MKLEPGDIILTRDKDSLFSNLVYAAMNTLQRDKVTYQHAVLVLNDKQCLEALSTIKVNNTRERLGDFEKYKIIRCALLTDERKKAIVDSARLFIGRKYGYWRIFLQLLDHIFNTNFFTEKHKKEDDQVCSSLVAWLYKKESGLEFNRTKWQSCDPDDIDDASIKNPTVWKTILEWEKD